MWYIMPPLLLLKELKLIRYPLTYVQEMFSMVAGLHGSKDVRKLCFGMLYGTFWFISKARNKLVFKKLRPSIKNTVKKIIAHLFSWVKNKSKHHSLSWQSRMICPDCCLFVRG
ncbi:hypothetical protein HanIR_Chr05g0218061 [Helianthus annuus]|nr:hypothetical protein HanIR_Chr05g0218061 [Helianthus annuus]